MLRRFAIGVLIIGLVGSCASTNGAPETNWRAYKEAGAKAYRQGHYTEAVKHLEAAVKDAEGFGAEDPRLANSLNDLGVIYTAQGKTAQAEPLYKRSLAIHEKALGPDHPWLAVTLNNLALLYVEQGKYAEAEPLYKRSVTIREKALGPDHPDVAETLENYASLLRRTGRDSEAAQTEAQAKAIRAKHAEQNPAK